PALLGEATSSHGVSSEPLRVHQRNLFQEPEDTMLAQPNHARDHVLEAVLRPERRHHLLLERGISYPLGSELVFSCFTVQLQLSLTLNVAAPGRSASAEVGLTVHHHNPDCRGARSAALVGADRLDGLEIGPLAPVGRRSLGAAPGRKRESQYHA